MNNIAIVRRLLEELVISTGSPVYSVCIEVISYLENNPKQNILTVGGLKIALSKITDEDNLLIQAAFVLTAYPFDVLDVRYKLYDTTLQRVIDDLDHATYMVALSEKKFIDSDGEIVALDELLSRSFPYFINLSNKVKPTDRQNVKGERDA